MISACKILFGGTDIKTKANDTIRCAFDGIVRMAKTYAAYGNVVVVRHDNGLESIYSHDRNLVKSGDIVKAGDAVGLTGLEPDVPLPNTFIWNSG